MRRRLCLFVFLSLSLVYCRSYRQEGDGSLSLTSSAKKYIVNDSIDKEKLKKLLDEGKISSSSLPMLLTEITKAPLNKKVKKTIMWKVTAPDRSQHWLFAAIHAQIPLKKFPKKSQLFEAIDESSIFMPENVEYFLSALRKVGKKHPAVRELSKMVDIQITLKGTEKKKIVEQLDKDLKVIEKYVREFQEAEKENLSNITSEDEMIDYQLNMADRIFKMNIAYINGDIARFTHLSKMNKNQRILLDRRNVDWVKNRIIPLCKEEEVCLIYPGINHVYDDESSIISLLQKEGFTLQRVD